MGGVVRIRCSRIRGVLCEDFGKREVVVGHDVEGVIFLLIPSEA